MRIVTFKIEEDLLKEFDEICRREGRMRSEVIRSLIREYVIRKRSILNRRIEVVEVVNVE